MGRRHREEADRVGTEGFRARGPSGLEGNGPHSCADPNLDFKLDELTNFIIKPDLFWP